jgi:NAD(P)-dependent dehydrogenase (short-subunit alcohol dehydrogenase family)
MQDTNMATQPFDLSGRIALVTGASRGIGAEIAKLLAQQGAHVIVSSRKLDGCKQVADEIIAAGGKAEAVTCHIGAMEDIAKIFEHIRAKHGRLDILINNAAANPYYGPLLDTDLNSFQKTVDVNIRGYFFMSVEGAKLMKQNPRGGAIVNTASVNGISPAPLQAVYSITKAAIINMTRVFAKDLGEHNIRVNAILPGLTKTKFAGALFEEEKTYRQWIDTIPMHRHAEPKEMAGAVLYLVSDAASYTTGECMVIDGGATI